MENSSNIEWDAPEGRAYLEEARQQLAKGFRKIEHCLDQLSEEQIWWRPTESQNSIGNLVLHLSGNVRQWIISGVGGEPDVRNRPQEFSERGPIPEQDLIRRLAETVQQADHILTTTSPAKLLASRRVQGFDTTAMSAIFDSVSHFQGHVQEIICLTRMQLGERYQFDWMPKSPEEGAP